MANEIVDASSVNVNVNVDKIIDQLLEFKIAKRERKEIQFLCKRSAEVFLSEPSLLELEGPLTVVGTRSNGRIDTDPISSYLTDIFIVRYLNNCCNYDHLFLLKGPYLFGLHPHLNTYIKIPRKAISMDNTTISFACLNKSSFHPLRNIYSLGITLVDATV